MSKDEVHISSLVVRAQPSYLDTLIKQISAFDEAEVCGSNPEGKIVVVVETSQQKFVSEIIDKINAFEGVLSTSLIFHQVDDQKSLARECE
jgi:nitrate reductase NapD